MSQTKAQLIEGLNINTSAPADALAIDSSGNVGIGTTSPANILHLSATGTPTIQITDADNSGIVKIENGSGSLFLNADTGDTVSNSRIQFGVDGSERLRIDNSGRLLLNTTTILESSSAAKLHIAHSTGPLIALGRDDSAVSVGNDMGKIAFYGNDGGSYEKVAQITCEADGSHASGDKPGRLLFQTTADGASSVTERMRIDSSGNLGIGTTSPSQNLHVSASSGTRIQVSHTGGSVDALLGTDSGNAFIGTSTNHDFRFITNNGERMRIDSSGNVGIGTSSPAALCHINKTSGTTLYRASVAGNSTIGLEIVKTGATTQSWRIADGQTVNGKLEFYDVTDSATRMCIDGSGNIGIGTTSPTTSLHVKGANTTGKGQLVVSSASAGQEARMTFIDGSDDIAEISTNGDNLYFYNEISSGAFQFYTGGSNERMRLNHDGQLIIGGTAQGGSNTKLRVNGDIDHLYNSSSPSAIRKRAISHAFTNLSTTATSMSNGLVNNACVVDVFLENKDSDQATFRFTSGRENAVAHKYSLVSGSNANCSVSLSTNVFTITGLGDGRTYTLTMSTSSIGTAPTLKASSTATGTTRLAMYSVGAF